MTKVNNMKIVTAAGTGLDTVTEQLRSYGATVTVLSKESEAFDVPMDRLILLGGHDVNPFFYGENKTHSYSLEKTRDVIEYVLARRAISEQVPIMGICRGHQMLAVASGGSLYQDMVKGGATKTSHSYYHELVDVKGPLREVLPLYTDKGKTRLFYDVNSLHHQCVKAMPGGFEVVARAPDGVIEAIWRPGALGVQFHPELMLSGDNRWAVLFDWFIDGLY